MADKRDSNDAARKEALFLSLVALLSQQAMMAMGKLVPPGADEPVVDLAVARVMIDTLDVLREKTEGRRNKEEQRYLDLQLTNLRLNFLEVQKAGGAPPADDEDDDSAEAEAGDDASK